MTYNQNMTLTVTAYGKTASITGPDDIDIYEFLDICHNLSIFMGYHEDSWKEAVIDMVNDYREEEKKQVERNPRNYSSVSDEHLQKTPNVYAGESNLVTQWGQLHESDC